MRLGTPVPLRLLLYSDEVKTCRRGTGSPVVDMFSTKVIIAASRMQPALRRGDVPHRDGCRRCGPAQDYVSTTRLQAQRSDAVDRVRAAIEFASKPGKGTVLPPSPLRISAESPVTTKKATAPTPPRAIAASAALAESSGVRGR